MAKNEKINSKEKNRDNKSLQFNIHFDTKPIDDAIKNLEHAIANMKIKTS